MPASTISTADFYASRDSIHRYQSSRTCRSPDAPDPPYDSHRATLALPSSLRPSALLGRAWLRAPRVHSILRHVQRPAPRRDTGRAGPRYGHTPRPRRARLRRAYLVRVSHYCDGHVCSTAKHTQRKRQSRRHRSSAAEPTTRGRRKQDRSCGRWCRWRPCVVVLCLLMRKLRKSLGAELATDIKDYYPSKSVTLVHSRSRVMHKFHPQLHELISARAEELGIKVVLNERVKVPEDGFPVNGTEFDVDLLSGSSLRADLVVRGFHCFVCFHTHLSTQDPCYWPHAHICTTTHARTRVPHTRRLHLRATYSTTRRPRISNNICDRRRCGYTEPKSGTARCPARACGSREHRASRRGREFR